MSQSWFQRAKKARRYLCNTLRKRQGKANAKRHRYSLLYIQYIYRNKAQKPVCKRQNPYYNKMYRKRPRYDFSHALQAHNTNNKLIKTIC